MQAEVITIPSLKGDLTGHADGMIRFVNRNTIIGNCRSDEDKWWSDEINQVLKSKDITYIDAQFFEIKDFNKKYLDNAMPHYIFLQSN